MIIIQFISVAVALISFIPGGIGIGELNAYYLWSGFDYEMVYISAAIILNRFLAVMLIVFSGVVSYFFIKDKQAKLKIKQIDSK